MTGWIVGYVLGCVEPEITGDPSMEVGTGEFDFESVEKGQEVPIVRGPQGGDHVWLGVRVRNLLTRRLRLDSQLYVSDGPEDTGVQEPDPVGEPFFFFPPFFPDEDEDGTFVTAGLPHQVTPGRVRGRRLRLEVIATDREERTVTGSMIIVPVRVE